MSEDVKMKNRIGRSVQLIIALVFLFSSFVAAPVTAASYAVNYNVNGVLAVQKDIPCLYTADGRAFKLIMSLDKAKKLDGKTVKVQGKVAKADELDTMKVKKITEISPKEFEVPEAEHEAYQRPAKLVAENKGIFKVANVRWNIHQDPSTKDLKAIHTWETVTINPEKLLRAYMIVKPFAPKFLAAHTLLAFTFAPGGAVAGNGEETETIVLTIEAYKKIGQTYGLLKTMKKEFDIVWILATLRNYAGLNINFNADTDNALDVYPINFTLEQSKALLAETIRQACVNRKGEYYHTIRNNCTNNVVILLNSALPKERQVKLWAIPSFIYNPKATMPLSVIKTLKKKEILSDKAATINRETFDKYVNGAASKAAKK